MKNKTDVSAGMVAALAIMNQIYYAKACTKRIKQAVARSGALQYIT